jgi:UDP-4-amino-4,6-dideoxy-N-acetyl-beta-L-altrosamine transaminase
MSPEYIPYGRQHITEADIQSVEEVLRSPFLTQGPAVPDFEYAVATQVGAKYTVAVNSATSALHIACLALGLGPGDRLWTTPITFVASANCARYCGAEIDFVDIDPASGLISVSELERKLESAALAGLLPKILVPVHLAGSSCAMAPISALARRYGVAVLEDASHAIGGRYKEEPVGNCQYSDITVFSFHPVKIITTGEGGLATTNDGALARRMVDLRSHGIVKEPSRFRLTPAGDWSYEQQELGFNYRMTDIQAALGLSQLQRLDQIVKERRELLNEYERMMTDLPLRMLEVGIDVQTAGHLAIIRLDNTCPEHHRAIFSGLRALQIGVQVHYTPVHLQPYYRNLGFRESDFPAAEAYATNAISLPIYPGLLKEHQERVVSCLSALLCNGSIRLRG